MTTTDQASILFTGGSGLLGRAFREILPGADYPGSADFDVVDPAGMERYVGRRAFRLVIHAAAFTSPPRVNEDPRRAIGVNIVGTANVVDLCLTHDFRLIYISTDYVFRGDRGDYTEDDPVLPVNNYAWSKLGGECAARLYDRALIVRTSFGPDVFPYPKALVDQWTSRQSVSETARMIAALIDTDLTGIIHVGGPRRSVFDYARSLDPSRTDIAPLSSHELSFQVPRDTSLNTDKYDRQVRRRTRPEGR
jgi:dTDP-4-dehydrorhamnose reductase